MKLFFINLMLRFLPCAFDVTNMNPGHFGTVRVFWYKTVDPIATVIGSGYFNAYTDQLRNGDIIYVTDTNVPTVDMIAVTSADNASTVTTLNGT